MAAQPIGSLNTGFSGPSRASCLAGRVLRAAGVEKLPPVACLAKAEIVDSSEGLAAVAPQLAALALHAAEPNALYAPHLLLATKAHLAPGLRVALIRQDGQLIGAFPMTAAQGPLGLVGGSQSLFHAHSFLSAPLVRKGYEQAAYEAYVRLIEAGRCGRFVQHALLYAQTPAADAFKQALARAGLVYRRFAPHQRACLASTLDGERYMRQAISRKRLKEYRRLSARLEEKGLLSFDLLSTSAEIEKGLQQFLGLEAAGWKGAGGTAMANSHGERHFIEDAFASGHGSVHVARLSLAGKPIAVALLISQGRTAFLWKIAHDESHAASSPGVLLVLALTRHILDEKLFDMVDSCAIADHPMIDRLWRERLHMEDLVVVRRGLLAQPLLAAHATWRTGRALAKRLYHRFTSRTVA